MEIWKEITINEITLSVSSLGEVKRNGKTISQFLKNGYKAISFMANQKVFRFYVHRLLAEAFIGKSDLQVNHKDSNKTNNDLSNLEYVTHRENGTHRYASNPFTGSTFDKTAKRWKSQIKINGKSVHLGSFKTAEEAHNTYLQALERYGITNKYA